jgi:inositol phosphorylceramide mannosyltransferase catalytic subunit
LNVHQSIPRRIIQTAKTKDLPMLAQAARVTLTELNPGFEYLIFDDLAVDTFVAERFPQYRDVFQAFPHRIQKYDFFRYLAVWELGGFYFDLDVFLVSSLVSLLDRGCVFPFESLTLNRFLRDRCNMDWELGNYAFGAARGHPFLEAIIQNCVRAQRDPDWVKPMLSGLPLFLRSESYVLNTTGPGLVSRTLAENADLAANMTVLFPEDVCDSSHWNQFGQFGIHVMDGSWRTRAHFVHRRLTLLWESWILRRSQRESSKLGGKRDIRTIRRPEVAV